jgi:hypothetical protein
VRFAGETGFADSVFVGVLIKPSPFFAPTTAMPFHPNPVAPFRCLAVPIQLSLLLPAARLTPLRRVKRLPRGLLGAVEWRGGMAQWNGAVEWRGELGGEMRPAPNPLVCGSGAGRVDQVKLRSGKDRQMTVTAVACGPLLPWVTV